MHLSIAERLRPFSHLPGTSTILPGSDYQVQIFPCLIRIYHLKKAYPLLLTELTLDLKGPVQQFTVCTDLEKGRLTVSGMTAQGWIRYHLMCSQLQAGIVLLLEKAPHGELCIEQEKQRHVLSHQQRLDLFHPSFEPYQPPACDRLSLGNHKAQDWELVKRRLDLAEIFPVWHRLGQLIPRSPQFPQDLREGTLQLLEECQQSFHENKPEKAEQKWLNLFLAGFSGVFVPQLEDQNYQGLIPPCPLASLERSPLILLSEGARLIRRLFVQQELNTLHILPYLLPSLSVGRLLNVQLEGGGMLSFEWTKKCIRRLILYAGQEQEIVLKFHSSVRSYRLRQQLKDQGERKSSHSSLLLKKNCYYFFDNFN